MSQRVLIAGDAASIADACRSALAADGADVLMLDADLREWDDIQRAVAEVVSLGSRIDVLVNVGSAGPATGSFVDSSEESLTHVVGLHLGGAVAVTRAVIAVMIPQRSGRIINIVSETGQVGGAGRVAYDACEAAVTTLTRNLAEEVPDDGISVVAVTSPSGGADPVALGGVVAFLASTPGAAVHGSVVAVGRDLP